VPERMKDTGSCMSQTVSSLEYALRCNPLILRVRVASCNKRIHIYKNMNKNKPKKSGWCDSELIIICY
jgi:hypothetical protein